MDILYQDKRILVAIKPAGVLSTDEPGGMPSLLREQLGDSKACVRTVHRLDQTVSGVMVFARSRAAASILSEQIRCRSFGKEYLAVVHGIPSADTGNFSDLLSRDKASRRTIVVDEPGKNVQEARLRYRLLAVSGNLSLVRIALDTGRTHQIRVQFASRRIPIVGDRKYGIEDTGDNIALWSCLLSFHHPETGENMSFTATPPHQWPWTEFADSAFS